MTIEKVYDINKEKLIDLYLNKKFSMDKISKEFNCCYWVINQRLHEYNIPVRNRWEMTVIKRNFLKHITINNYIQQILDGVMISDGYYEKGGSTKSSRLMMIQSLKQKEWVDFLEDTFRKNGIDSKTYFHTTKAFGKEYSQYGLATKGYVEFLDERKRWYPKGKKVIPQDIDLTPLMLAHWYMGDGCLHIGDKKRKKKYYRLFFCTESFKPNDVLFLKNKLNKEYNYNFITFNYCNSLRLENNHQEEIKDFLLKTNPYKISCFDYKWRMLNTTSP